MAQPGRASLKEQRYDRQLRYRRGGVSVACPGPEPRGAVAVVLAGWRAGCRGAGPCPASRCGPGRGPQPALPRLWLPVQAPGRLRGRL